MTDQPSKSNHTRQGTRRRHHGSSGRLRERSLTLLDELLMTGISLGLLALPLARGGRADWAPPAIALVVTTLFAGWLLRLGIRGELRMIRFKGLGIAAGVLLVAMLQMLPGKALLNWLAPAKLERWLAAQAAGATDLAPQMSLAPERTLNALLLVAMLLLFLFLVLQTFTSRRRIVFLAVGITAAGALAAVIGIWPLLTGGDNWYAELGMNEPYAHGTFMNRNHFAAMIGISMLVGLGLATGIYVSRRQPRADDEQIHHEVGRYAELLLLVMSVVLMMMAAAEILSLSRAATACTGLALAIFAILLLYRIGRARRFYVGLALVGALLFAATTPALERLAGRYEKLVGPGTIGTEGRFAVWQDALKMLPKYWHTGVGLGAFEFASPRYESGWMPDKVSFHAHNDWLEILIELGIPLGLLVCGGIVWLLIAVWRKILPQPDPLLLWPGIGACLGLSALALHEWVEYSLRSPAVAFQATAVLALAILAGHLPGQRSRRQLKRAFHVLALPLPARGAALVAAPLILTAVALWAVPRVGAGVKMEKLRRLSREPDAAQTDAVRYRRSEHAASLAEQILHTLPSHSYTRRQLASHRLLMFSIALDTARQAGDHAASPRLGDELDSIIRDLQSACRQLPTHGLYQAQLAQALEQQGLLRRNLDEAAVARLYRLAQENFPQVGTVTRICADAAWRRYLRAEIDSAAAAIARREALALYRRVIEQNPDLARGVYRQLWGPTEDPELLLAVTPDLLRAHFYLYDFLYGRERYSDCLRHLDRMQELNEQRPAPDTSDRLPLYYQTRMLRTPKESVAADLRQRRILLLGLLQRWDERETTLQQFRTGQRLALEPALAQAEALVERGRYRQAQSIINGVLQQDPWFPKAILAAARIETLIGRPDHADAMIFRFVFAPQEIGNVAELQAALHQAQTAQTRLPRSTEPPPFPEHRFLEAALQFRIGRISENSENLRQALQSLQELTRLRRENAVLPWLQEPMLHLYRGRAHESLGEIEAAMAAYANALETCPQHLFTAQAVRQLGRRQIETAELTVGDRDTLLMAIDWLDGLDLPIPLRSNFGAMVQLYGIRVRPDVLPYFGTTTIQTAWLCTSAILHNYSIQTRFHQQNQAVFGDLFEPADPMPGWRVGELVVLERELQPARQAVQRHRRLEPGWHTVGFYLLLAGRQTPQLQPTPPAHATAFTVVIQPDPIRDGEQDPQ